jgi:Arc/MetJ-type ribon-helix-helix transcriptional regulator
MTTGRERQAELRRRRQAAGVRQVTVWLDQESLSRLATLRGSGERDSDVVRRALQTLAEAHHRAHEEHQRALEAQIRAWDADGFTMRQIANRLNKAGEPAGTENGRWDVDTVLAWLVTNAVYEP